MWLYAVIGLLVGLLIGFLLGVFVRRSRDREAQALAKDLFDANRDQSRAEMTALLESAKSELHRLSTDSLQKSTEELLKLAETKLGGQQKLSSQELEAKKALIDQQLTKMTAELEKVSNLVTEYEKDRSVKFGELNRGLESITKQTDALALTTNALKEALSSSQARGQWGQRMADDVLRLAGFVEGVNYTQQTTQADTGRRPDYTFFLPNDQTVNMDVKFPLDNYLRYLQAENDADRDRNRKAFLKDVRVHVKSLATREYVSADGATLDYVLLFIPNESVYSFIHREDPQLLDDALTSKVILCSPMTLFAVLAVVRQSVESFALQRTSNEMLALFGAFRRQWDKFTEALGKLGARIAALQSEYTTLTTTRKNQLEKPLARIEDLRVSQAIPVTAVEDSEEEAESSQEPHESDEPAPR